MVSNKSSITHQALILLFFFLLALSSAHAKGGIAIYWGQNNGDGTLTSTCDTGNFEIVLLAFLYTFGCGTTPDWNFAVVPLLQSTTRNRTLPKKRFALTVRELGAREGCERARVRQREGWVRGFSTVMGTHRRQVSWVRGYSLERGHLGATSSSTVMKMKCSCWVRWLL
ncbi:hypothetical protein S245_031533 [Arachis hypogaea]|nr:Acidic endochitinase [Arachis hypogaea]